MASQADQEERKDSPKKPEPNLGTLRQSNKSYQIQQQQ